MPADNPSLARTAGPDTPKSQRRPSPIRRPPSRSSQTKQVKVAKPRQPNQPTHQSRRTTEPTPFSAPTKSRPTAGSDQAYLTLLYLTLLYLTLLVPSSGGGMPSSSPGSVYVPLGLPAPRVRLPRRMLDLSIASASSFSVSLRCV